MKTNTEWHRVVIFNPVLADIAEKYVKKAQKVTWRDNFKPENGKIVMD